MFNMLLTRFYSQKITYILFIIMFIISILISTFVVKFPVENTINFAQLFVSCYADSSIVWAIFLIHISIQICEDFSYTYLKNFYITPKLKVEWINSKLIISISFFVCQIFIFLISFFLISFIKRSWIWNFPLINFIYFFITTLLISLIFSIIIIFLSIIFQKVTVCILCSIILSFNIGSSVFKIVLSLLNFSVPSSNGVLFNSIYLSVKGHFSIELLSFYCIIFLIIYLFTLILFKKKDIENIYY